MRKLVLSYYVSIDGKSVDVGNGMREVMGAIDDAEQDAAYVNELWEAGAFLMGRKSYAAMKGFWPTSEHPSAPPMNAIPKVVFSRTRTTSDDAWPARIVGGDLGEQVAQLKAEPGKDLVACADDESCGHWSSSAWSMSTGSGYCPLRPARARRSSPRSISH